MVQNIYRSPLQDTKKGSRQKSKRRTCWKSVSVSKRQRIKRKVIEQLAKEHEKGKPLIAVSFLQPSQ